MESEYVCAMEVNAINDIKMSNDAFFIIYKNQADISCEFMGKLWTISHRLSHEKTS